ncbi:MAG TPA: sugar ABC transporter permease [Thermomicrobiales bacterium]
MSQDQLAGQGIPGRVSVESRPRETLQRPVRRGFIPFRIWMVLPTIVGLLAVVGFPLLYALWVSLHEYDLTEGGIGDFVRFENFSDVLGMDVFIQAAKNTVVLTVSVVLLELAIALGLALLLNQPGLRFRNIYLAILLIPLLVSPVAVGLIWRLLLHPDLGAVNWLLKTLGLPGQEWLGNRSTAMPAVIGVDVWHETSLLLVIVLAGLTALPKEPMEAAVVDGANRWQVFWTVTLPLLAPVILVAVLIRMIAAMKTYDLIYILTAGGPGGATETISFRIWKVGFTNLDMGRASAASVLLLLVILALTAILIRVMRVEEN